MFLQAELRIGCALLLVILIDEPVRGKLILAILLLEQAAAATVQHLLHARDGGVLPRIIAQTTLLLNA